MGTWCLTSSTRTPPPRRRASSTRRRVKRRPKLGQLCLHTARRQRFRADFVIPRMRKLGPEVASQKKNSCPVGEQGVTFRKLKRPKWMRKIRFPEEHLEIRLLFLPWGVLRGFLLLNLLTAISSSNIECQDVYDQIPQHQQYWEAGDQLTVI